MSRVIVAEIDPIEQTVKECDYDEGGQAELSLQVLHKSDMQNENGKWNLQARSTKLLFRLLLESD